MDDVVEGRLSPYRLAHRIVADLRRGHDHGTP
jgi:hypothetical protein